MPKFEGIPLNVEKPKIDPRKEFQSRLNMLLLEGAPLREVAEMLGAEEYIEGEVGSGIRFNVKAFADEQLGIEEEKGSSQSRTHRVPLLPPEKFIKTERVLLPPGRGEIIAGSGKGLEEKRIYPRDRAFIEVLSEMKEPYSVISGVVRPEMMRRQTYRAFILKNRQKIFFINNEEGNATYVVHGVTANDWSEYAGKTKDELREVKNIEVINYPGNLSDFQLLMRSVILTELESLQEVGENDDEITSSADQGDVSTIAGELIGDRSAVGEEMLSLDNKIEGKRFSPEGWMTITNVQEEIGKSYRWITRIADSYRDTHPEWFVEFLNKQGREREYYHPELIALIKQEQFSLPSQAPDGWLNRGSLVERHKKSHDFIRSLVEKYRESHPEWFGEYLGDAGRSVEYFHPDLVAIIDKTMASLPDAPPEGWETQGSLVVDLKTTHHLVTKLADEFRTSNPEWFREFINDLGHVNEYYHPELVHLLRVKIEKQNRPIPEGWVSVSLLSKVLPVSKEKIERIIREQDLLERYPNDFGEYKNSNGLVGAFYGDTIVSSIKKYIDNMPERAPDGWTTTSALRIELGIDFYVIEKIAEKYRESHPEWFQVYLSPLGKEVMHLSPDLSNAIRKEVKSRPPVAPDGWYTNKRLKSVLGSTQQTVGKIAEKYRDSHPEWFQNFTFRAVRGSSVREHYHPDLVQLITKELANRPQVAPEGWETQGSLAKKLNVQPEAVMKVINSLPEGTESLIETFSEPKGRGGHGGRKLLKYFHPDLVRLITQEVKKLKNRQI